MQSVDNATRAALDSGAIHVRIVAENGQLFVPVMMPVHDPSGPPLFVIAASAFSGGVSDGTILSLEYSAACSDGDIGIGSVSSASISAQIQGVYSLLGLVLRAQYGVDVGGTVKWFNLGSFTVTECTTTDHTTQFTGYDAAYTLTGEYNPRVLSGSTVKAILTDLSVQAGVEVEPSTLAMGENIHTDGSLSGKNYREMLGYLAGLCGKNAVVTRDGAIKFLWYSSSGAEVTADDYYSGEMSNGGVSNFLGINCTVPGTEDAREDTVLAVGNAEKAVEYINPYMTQERLNAIWSAIGGYSYPIGNVGFFHGMLTEPGDIITLTNLAGVSIQLPVMSVDMTFDGGCRCNVSSWGKSDEVRADKYRAPTMQAVQRVLENVATGVYDGTSVSTVTRYYQLANEAPSSPTTLNPGSSWTTTEPTYSENNPEHLYFVDRTVYDNDTYQYSTVSLSSSYEAAKDAHAKAVEAAEAAAEAQDTADDAMEAAEDAQGAADDAMRSAQEAKAAASAAAENAARAMTSANGKNKVFHRYTAPSASEGLTAGDIWFDTANDYRINTWTGSAWSAFELGEDAIANLSITNAKIANATIEHGKIASLDMGKATVGKLLAQFIDVVNLFAQDITATNSFNLDTTNCKLKAYGNNRAGFSLGVKNSSGSNPFTSGISAYDKYLSLYTDAGNISIDPGDGGNLYLGDGMFPMSKVTISTNKLYLPNGSDVYLENSFNHNYTDLDSYIDNRASYAAPSISVSSVSASVSLTGNTYNGGNFSVYKSGYTPLGVVGFDISGSRSNYMLLYRSYISGSTYYWQIRNTSSDTVTDDITVYVLYVKN